MMGGAPSNEIHRQEIGLRDFGGAKQTNDRAAGEMTSMMMNSMMGSPVLVARPTARQSCRPCFKVQAKAGNWAPGTSLEWTIFETVFNRASPILISSFLLLITLVKCY